MTHWHCICADRPSLAPAMVGFAPRLQTDCRFARRSSVSSCCHQFIIDYPNVMCCADDKVLSPSCYCLHPSKWLTNKLDQSRPSPPTIYHTIYRGTGPICLSTTCRPIRRLLMRTRCPKDVMITVTTAITTS